MRKSSKKVLVLVEVDVDRRVDIKEVRNFIAREAQTARGQYTGFDNRDDWRQDYTVKLRDLPLYNRNIIRAALEEDL